MEWIPEKQGVEKRYREWHSRRSTIFPKINWGSGRLLPYESLGAFAAQFCVLNDVTARACRSFFTEMTGQTDWWLNGFQGEAQQIVANLLGEPKSVVESLSAGKWELPACYGQFVFAKPTQPNQDFVSYCPACRALGYHASFHEIGWLKECLIHRVDLVHARFASWSNSGYFDRYANEIGNVFDGGTKGWAALRNQATIETWLSSRSFQYFQKWIQSARSFADRERKHNIISFPGEKYQEKDLGVLLGRIEWRVPIAEDIRSVFKLAPYPQKPIIRRCSVKATRKLRELVHDSNTHFFWTFLRKTAILNKTMTLPRMAVREAVEKLKRESRKKSNWGWLRKVGWTKVAPDGWPHWQIIKPCEVFIRRLRYKWMDFAEVDPPQQQTARDWFLYCEWAKVLHRHGLVTPLREHLLDFCNLKVSAKIQPLVEIAIDSEVMDLCEILLHHEACIDVDNALFWLEGLKQGLTPRQMLSMAATSNGNLMLEGDNAYLLVWPRIRRVSEGGEFDEFNLDQSEFTFSPFTSRFSVGE